MATNTCEYDQDGQRGDAEERSDRRRNALAALEAEPHRKHVAEDGAEPGERRQDVHRVRAVIGNVVGMMLREEEDVRDGDVSLERIEQKRRDGQSLGAGAGDVGGADVAAAGLAHVLAAEDADEQVAEGDRAQQVRRRR